MDRHELEAVVRNVFESNTMLIRAEILGGGLFNTTYLLETEKPHARLVLRVAPIRQELLFDFERKMMSSEPLIYKLMSDHHIPCPIVVKHDNSKTIIPREYLVTEYLEGSVTLNSEKIPEDVKPKLWFDVGQYTARIHGITGSRFGWVNPDGSIRGSNHWAETLLDYIEEIVRRISQHAVFDEPTIQIFHDLFTSNRSLFEIKDQPSLVHNDIWGPNVLAKPYDGEWQVAAIIDADRAMFADRDSEFLLWNPDSNAVRGYGRTLDMSKEAILRRHFYKLKHNFFDAYVHKVQYNNEAEYLNNKTWALERMKMIQEYE